MSAVARMRAGDAPVEMPSCQRAQSWRTTRATSRSSCIATGATATHAARSGEWRDGLRRAGLCGDGGFLTTGQEMEIAVRYGVEITVVVFRNGMHGTIAMHQARALGRTAGAEIGEVDLAGYARRLGAAGYTVRDYNDLAPELEEALSAEAPALVDVVTDPDLISPTARLSEFAGGQE